MDSSAVTCPQCGAPVRLSARQCGSCGESLEHVVWQPSSGIAPAPGIERRDRWIGIGGALGAACTAPAAIGALMVMISDLNHHVLTGVGVSDGFSVLSPVMVVVGAALFGSAFLGARRSMKLARSAISLAFSFVAVCVATAILAGIFAAHHVLGSLTAAIIASSVAAAIEAGAFMRAATAFTDQGDAAAGADRLGQAAVVFATATIASITSGVLALVASSKLQLSGTTTTAEALDLASTVLEFGAAIVIAVAFFGAASGRRLRTSGWLRRRDGLLAVAAGVLAVALLLYAIGTVIEASQQGQLVPNLVKAGRWFGAVSNVTVIAAFACLTAGLYGSGRQPS